MNWLAAFNYSASSLTRCKPGRDARLCPDIGRWVLGEFGLPTSHTLGVRNPVLCWWQFSRCENSDAQRSAWAPVFLIRRTSAATGSAGGTHGSTLGFMGKFDLQNWMHIGITNQLSGVPVCDRLCGSTTPKAGCKPALRFMESAATRLVAPPASAPNNFSSLSLKLFYCPWAGARLICRVPPI